MLEQCSVICKALGAGVAKACWTVGGHARCTSSTAEALGDRAGATFAAFPAVSRATVAAFLACGRALPSHTAGVTGN